MFWLILSIFCYIFIISGLLVNFIQLLTWIFIRPWNKSLYRLINYYLASLIWSQLTFLYTYWANSEVTIYVDPHDAKYINREHALYLPNHRYEIDWLVALVVNRYLGFLGGTKIVGKRSLASIPVLGYSWFFTESIFLRRTWITDRKILEKDIQELVNDYPKDHFFNVIITCEGTRYTEEKRLESMKYAREKGLPELKYHILPRTKGASLVMQGVKGKIPAVYNFVLAFSKDSAPTKLRSILNRQPCRAHVYLKRISMLDIPYENEEQSAQWIHEIFREKDQIYEYFLQNDKFNLPQLTLKRNYRDLIIEIFWLVSIAIPSLIYFVKFIFYSSLMAKCLFGIISFISYIIFQWMINQSVVKK